jgi:transposase InsO family protein
MSRKANCWDNAVAESFFRTLKSELIHPMKEKLMEVAKIEVFEFIEIWYNRKRIHASLGYMTPDEYGIQLNQHRNAA